MVIRHRNLAQHRGRPALGPLSLAALLILQQVLAFAGEIAETPKLTTPLNLGGAANAKTAPALPSLPTGVGSNIGVSVEIPAGVENGAALMQAGVESTVSAAPNAASAEANPGALSAVPISAATPEMSAPRSPPRRPK
jgi:hypothetical protein